MDKDFIIFVVVTSTIFYMLYKMMSYLTSRFSTVGRSSGKTTGYVYIISNPSFQKDIYKIGMTERTVPVRIKELFSTGVPTPFVIELKIAHKNPKKLEDYLHKKLQKYRINKRREFFKVPLSKIREELSTLGLI